MSKFKHIHSSSLYSRSVKALHRAAVGYNADASLVTYTEVSQEAREKALKRAGGEGFGLVAGDVAARNECAIAYDKKVFRLVYKEMFKATDRTFNMTGGRKSGSPVATIAVFEHLETKKRVAVLVIHLPSSVESDIARKNKTLRTLTWHSAFRNSRRRLRKVAKNHAASSTIFAADFNINFKKIWARALIRTLAPAFRLTWNDVKFSGGTHGKRVIDGTLLNGNIKVEGSAKLYQDDASSDHRPYVETLRLT